MRDTLSTITSDQLSTVTGGWSVLDWFNSARRNTTPPWESDPERRAKREAGYAANRKSLFNGGL